MHVWEAEEKRRISVLEHRKALTSTATEEQAAKSRRLIYSIFVTAWTGWRAAVSRDLPASYQHFVWARRAKRGCLKPLRVAWASNDVDFDFIFVCIASLHIARFRAGVASSEVTYDGLRVRVFDTLRLYAIPSWA